MLEILPENGLDRSILLPVLVGLGYTTLFTETLGWTFVALVVPGYLSSVFIVAPVSGMVMVGEAVMTYLVARLIGVWLPSRGTWLVFFGRERFYLIIVVSVFIRLLTEGYVLPAAARWFAFRHAADLFSIGLVIVPLTANAFWNVGLRRGFRRTGTITALTWATLVFAITPMVNLNLSYFEYTYESVALDFFASPKAYFLILIGAIVGARTNLRFGWDYNGILVPGLLAVAWYSPLKLGSTLVEAAFVSWLAQRLLYLPVLNQILMEGPRRTLYVFSVGFVVKFFLGHVLGAVVPAMSATDLYGFGYVLPSLVAVKIWQKRNVPRILVPAVAASFAAFLLANVLGYSLHLAMPGVPTAAAKAPQPEDQSFPNVRTFAGAGGDSMLRWALTRATSWPLRRTADQGAAPDLALPGWLLDQRDSPERAVDPAELDRFGLVGRSFVGKDGTRFSLLRGEAGSSPAMPSFLVQHRTGARGVAFVETSPCGPEAAAALDLARNRRAMVLVLHPPGQWVGGWKAAFQSSFGEPLPVSGSPASDLADSALLEPLPPKRSFLPFAGAGDQGEAELLAVHQMHWPTRSHVRRRTLNHDELRCFSSQIVPWLRGQRAAKETEASHASAVASWLGLLLVPTERGRAVLGQAPGDLLWLHRADASTVAEAVSVPFPEFGLGTAAAGRWLAEVRHARDLLIGGHAGGYRPDAGGLTGARSLQQRAIELLLEQPEQRVLVVRMLPSHHERHGVDVVLTGGVLGNFDETSWIAQLRLTAQARGTVEVVDGRRALFPLRGTGDPMLHYGRHLAPGRVVISWWASRPRHQFLEAGEP